MNEDIMLLIKQAAKEVVESQGKTRKTISREKNRASLVGFWKRNSTRAL